MLFRSMLSDYSVRFAGHTFTCLDKGFDKNEQVDVVVRPEDVDVVEPERGMLTGQVSAVTFKGVHYEIIVDIKGFKWMIQSTDYVAPEQFIGLYIEPDAIHIMKKSKYSGCNRGNTQDSTQRASHTGQGYTGAD